MSTPLAETHVQHGRLAARFFTPDNTPGDWQPYTVNFATPFAGDDVRVIATASDDLVPPPQGTVPVVPVVLGANRNGFTVMARNSDVASGSAGLHWVAVRESPGTRGLPPVDVRTLRVLPQGFMPDGQPGDWNSWPVVFGQPMAQSPSVVASAWWPDEAHSDFRFEPDQLFIPAALWSSGAVPIAVCQGAHRGGLQLAARNGGGWHGVRAMNGVAFSAGPASDPGVMVASGVTAPVSVSRGGGSDRQLIDVAFATPFSAPPVVLFCATNQGLPAGVTPPAAAGWVQSVGTHGFRLAALNTDSVGGPVAYFWVALGCGPACGSRTPSAPPGTTFKPPIKITVPFPFLWAGSSQWAGIVDAEGRAWAAERFEWASSQPEVATVFADGRIQARKPGKAVLVARGEEGEAKVEVEVRAVG